MRTWRLLFAMGLLAALLVPASTAMAKPHETAGDVHTECQVNGQVTLHDHDDNDSGLDNNRSEGKYTFTQTNLMCNGTFNGTWNVDATGDTTDLWHGENPKKTPPEQRGEDCEQGGSNQNGDELHTGDIEADAKDPGNPNLSGGVHFARLGTVVLADGPLDGSDGSSHFFQAELVFLPTVGDCMDKDDPVTQASLTGTAEIYSLTGVWFHDCTQEGTSKHNADPHCGLHS